MTAEILRKVNHKNIRLNWDPCNSVNSGGKPLDEYERIKDLIGHLHIKDTTIRHEGNRVVAIGEGDINWKEILTSLHRDGYQGYYTVETHFGPLVKASKSCVENLKRILLEIC